MTLHFTYTAGNLKAFERFLLSKTELSGKSRFACLLTGIAGLIVSGFMLWQSGLQLMPVLILTGSLILLRTALHRNSAEQDARRFRTCYLGRTAQVSLNRYGIELHLENRAQGARVLWKKIHGLYRDTRNWYLATGSRAYFIIPRSSLNEQEAESFQRFVREQTRRQWMEAA